MLNAINAGQFAEITEIAEYSDGTFSGLIAEGGDYEYLRAWNIAPDGGWYYLGCADGNGTSLNLDHDDVDYLVNWPMHTWYNLNIAMTGLKSADSRCRLRLMSSPRL